MRAVIAVVVFASFAVAQEPPTPKGFQRVKLNGQTFTLPDGFTIEVAAKAPQVDRPVTMALDDKGRLYVADSSGDNSRPAEQLKNPTHRVVRLESTKGDGVYDKSTVFADKLSFLQGTMWHKGSLYVAAPPRVLKLTDTDGDGVADKRETWFDGGTLTGCANDLHGPYLGPDGLFYWTKGAFAKQTLKLKGGKTLTTRAAHVFRAKPDATDIEVVMTGGMDNPVGVAFLPTGEVFCSCTFIQHPAGGKRDALLHCAYGAIYGKDHDPIREQPWTDTQYTEPMTHLGPAAPAGLHAYRSNHFGPDFTGNLFSAQFNMAKVGRHILKPKGATFETVDSDFVKSDSKDFHPTDVIEDADGSLLIADTGGWYKLCCPSSVLEKKDVLGAIYRVRKTNGEKAKPVNWPPLRAATTESTRDAAGLLRDIERIGRTRDTYAALSLWTALDRPNSDAIHRRAAVRALIDCGDERTIRKAFGNLAVGEYRSVALLALAGLGKDALSFADVQPAFTGAYQATRDVAWFLAERRDDWSPLVALYFEKRLAGKLDPPDLSDWDKYLHRFAGRPVLQRLLVPHVKNPFVLPALATARPAQVVAEWQPVLAGLLDQSPSADTARMVFAILAGVPNASPVSEELRAALTRAAANEAIPEEYRLQAAARVMRLLDATTFRLVLASCASDKPGAVRAAAADVLARCLLSEEQLIALAEALPSSSPVELPRLMDIFKKWYSPGIGRALLAAVVKPTVRAVTRSEQLRDILAKYPKPTRDAAEKVYLLLDADRKDQRKKLSDLQASMKAGDARRGHLIFNSAKASCAACHKIAYVGGSIGPDLTRIGSIRTETDLLEAIVFPSASFVRSYEPVSVTTLDGRTFTGILKADAPAEVVLTVSATEEVRIARKDIDVMKPGAVSVMPAGLDQQLSPQDLADLIAFLKGRN